MRLLAEDEEYLDGKGYKWKLIQGNKEAYLVISSFPLKPGVFDRDVTDLMIRIPGGYNMAKLDMFYVDPPLKLSQTKAYPTAADRFPTIAGRTWQQFSRHLPDAAWRPGVHSIATFLVFVRKELRVPQ